MRLPYLWRPVVKGRRYTYLRRSGRTIRLPDPHERGFVAAYQAALQATEPDAPPAAGAGLTPGSLAALIAAYRASPEFQQRAAATRRTYGAVLDQLAASFGTLPVATMPRAFVFKLRDRYAVGADGTPTPRRANQVIDTLRLLLSWAVNRGWRKDNPALRPGKLKTGPGYATWPAAAVEQFLTTAPEPMRRALLLGLYTGQRLGDCLAMTWADRGGGAISVVQSKTGTRVWIPEHPVLTAALDAAPRTAPTILTRESGHPWGKDHFAHRFAAAVKAAGLTGLTFHGLRKTAAARLAEASATADEIMAITGHRTHAEVTRYTAGAAQQVRAASAIQKLRDWGTDKPARDE